MDLREREGKLTHLGAPSFLLFRNLYADGETNIPTEGMNETFAKERLFSKERVEMKFLFKFSRLLFSL